MVQAADDVQFGRPALVRLPRAVLDLIFGHDIGAVFVEVRPERAKIALVDADIRGIEMRIDIVIAEVSVVPFAD